MSETNLGAEFLQQKYKLNADPGVVATANRRNKLYQETILEGEYPFRIQNYLDRLRDVIRPPTSNGTPDLGRQHRKLEKLKYALHDKFVIKPDKIPKAYYDSIKRKHREEGHGDIEIPDDYRIELAETVVSDQQRSLDNWVDYLASDDAKYPDYLKYYAMRSVLRMGRYDKEKKSFTERTGGTVSPFPDLNREALSIVLGDTERQEQGDTNFEFIGRYDIESDVKEKYRDFLKQKNFAKLYALAIEEFKPIAEELLKNTNGRWVIYPRGSDHLSLVSSIVPYGTGWCLRGEAMAQRYLVRDQNDLHVYYSDDAEGKPTVPRVVMVVNAQNKITEVRGVEKGENLDPYIGDVVQVRLDKHPDGKKYAKKSADMKRLTEVDNKTKAGNSLGRDDLLFLYEIEDKIEGFGYNNERDPRIAELRVARKPKDDAPIVIDCRPEEIAQKKSEITARTKAYVGKLEPGIFSLLSNLEHVYTSFPDGKVRFETATIGGQTTKELQQALKKSGINVDSSAEAMMNHKDFTTQKISEQVDLVRLHIADLGFTTSPTTDEIFHRATEFGLELCPAEVGPHRRLATLNQSMGDWEYIAMKQIPGAGGYPFVFGLERDEGGLWLRGR